MDELTYPEVGATAEPDALPPGYRHLRYRTCLGRADLDAAAEAVLTWRLHRAAGVHIDASADRAVPGVHVTSRLGIGPLRIAAPCRVVAVVDEPDRRGFSYGTVAGHPATGEESFTVERAADGRVWFAVTAFSRPARLSMRAAGPVAPLLQRAFAARLGRRLRGLVGDDRPHGPSHG